MTNFCGRAVTMTAKTFGASLAKSKRTGDVLRNRVQAQLDFACDYYHSSEDNNAGYLTQVWNQAKNTHCLNADAVLEAIKLIANVEVATNKLKQPILKMEANAEESVINEVNGAKFWTELRAEKPPATKKTAAQIALVAYKAMLKSDVDVSDFQTELASLIANDARIEESKKVEKLAEVVSINGAGSNLESALLDSQAG